MAQPNKLGGKRLTEELRKLAVEAYTIDDQGDPVTREGALAALIWRQALGWEEKTRDAYGNQQIVSHPPVAWCQQFLYERMEGKAPVATAEAGDGIKAVDKVRKLAVDRLNRIASGGGPPAHKPRSDDGV